MRAKFGEDNFRLVDRLKDEEEGGARAPDTLLDLQVSGYARLLEHAQYLRLVRRRACQAIGVLRAIAAMGVEPGDLACPDRLPGSRVPLDSELRLTLQRWVALFPWHSAFVYGDVDFVQALGLAAS